MEENSNFGFSSEELDAAWEDEGVVSNSDTASPDGHTGQQGDEPDAAGSGQPGQDQSGKPEQGGGEPKESAEPSDGQKREQQDQRFTLRLMGEDRQVSVEEMTALAQKGLDYDRIRGELDGFKMLGRYETVRDTLRELGDVQSVLEMKAFVEELAQSAGQSIPDMMDSTRAAMLSRKEGIDQAAALERVKLQKRETALQARERALEAGEARRSAASAAEEARRADFAAFARSHPDVRPESIPKEVWASVKAGESLTTAYERHEGARLREENKRLSARVAALEQNASNRERSAGSQRGGGRPARESWEDDWYSDD